jgi:hypothetical protein
LGDRGDDYLLYNPVDIMPGGMFLSYADTSVHGKSHKKYSLAKQSRQQGNKKSIEVTI